MTRSGWVALLCLAACKQPAPSPKHKDALRAAANRAWMDLQLCLGGAAPLPGGDKLVAQLDRVKRSRLAADDWPQRCAAYGADLEGLLRASDLPEAADAAAKVQVRAVTASAWDALAAAITTADLPTYGWDAKQRPVARPATPSDPALVYADLKVQPAPPLREGSGPAPLIPGERPPAAALSTCTSGTTEAILSDGALAIGTTRDGWVSIPFAQPIDPDKPLVCGDGTAELAYAHDGVWRVACTRGGCTYEHAALGGLVQDALFSGGQLLAALRGASGRVFLVRAPDMQALAATTPTAIVDAPDATVHLRPLDGGAALVLEEGGKARVVQITRDGKMFAM